MGGAAGRGRRSSDAGTDAENRGRFRPKQFVRVVGNQTLFEQTRARLAPLFPDERQVFVLSSQHEGYYSEQLVNARESLPLVQPLNRGTGIGMLLTVIQVLRRDRDAVVGFFPCDHYYSNDDSFQATVQLATESVRQHPDSLILVGAEPEYPEVEYGWIEPIRGVFPFESGPLFRVSRFWEKPDLSLARTLMRRGCLWNTFVTVGRAAAFLEAFCAQVPQAVATVMDALASRSLESSYHLLPIVDFSRDVLTHETGRLRVLRDRTSGWADLGSPARVVDILKRNGIQQNW